MFTLAYDVRFISVFTRGTIYAIARICHANSVCLSVCLSHACMYCIKTAERIIEILSRPDGPSGALKSQVLENAIRKT